VGFNSINKELYRNGYTQHNKSTIKPHNIIIMSQQKLKPTFDGQLLDSALRANTDRGRCHGLPDGVLRVGRQLR
jgi:hypothetical protein